ncbi:MAG: hypothetical protein E7256_14785 [Lachnospiraceae bacterium]|nr:hypothetical protein [Lachnospiraceae bacterium]
MSIEQKDSIYIMISKTQTGFAKMIRLFGRVRYSHAAIALDEGLNDLYAFARPQKNGIFISHLVKENIYRYALGEENVDVVIFKIPVTLEQYTWVANTIHSIAEDPEYKYNLFSVISYPITRGFHTYKAFSCIEFVMYVLKGIGYSMKKPLHAYRPDDLLEFFSENIHFEGNLLDYAADEKGPENYYAPLTMDIVKRSFSDMGSLIARLVVR